MYVNVKLESSGYRSISDFQPGSIDRRTGSIDRISAERYFLQISNSALAHLKRLGFYVLPKYIRQTLAMF